jgi:hypothetical protein
VRLQVTIPGDSMRYLKKCKRRVYNRMAGECREVCATAESFCGPVIWFSDDLSVTNQHCLYCGSAVGLDCEIPSDREHLIGRRFVPPGSLEGTFNLIFRACKACNAIKGNAERHVSSLTLLNSPARLDDERVDAEARRKAAGDFHPDKKGVLVQDAGDTHEICFGTPGAGVSMTFTVVSPPQLNGSIVCRLASFHVQGFVALITAKDLAVPIGVHYCPPGRILHFGDFPQRDWGNPQLAEITRRVMDWPCYLQLNAANGFFRGLLRRNPSEPEIWFWALEWNRSLRVVGAIADPSARLPLFNELPDLDWALLPGNRRMRNEVSLREERDTLFLADIV